jgi:MFS family permease
MGALFALGVFLGPIERSMGWGRGAISSVALLNWIAMGIGSFVWGSLSDRIGGRGVALGGGFLLGLGLVLASQAQALWQFYATFGFLVGFSVGAFYAPLTSTATKWFTARRGLAVSLVSAGIGFGILLIAPLARALTSAWDWRIAMLVIGDLAWVVIIPVALLLREDPAALGVTARGGPAAAPQREYTAGQVLTAPQFWAIALTHLACCAAHSGPIFHMVTHATDQGVAAMAAATVLGVSGLSSIAGRIGGGLLADRFGAKPTLIAGLALQAATIFVYLYAQSTASFYGLALVFGVAYGGVMPLYALVTREYFGERVMGSAYGAVFLISTLGMGVGSFAGGVIYDRLGSYAWLFLGSFAIGAMAIVLAFTFRRPPPVALGFAEAPAAR